jgi:hypothetical protein
VEPKGVRIDGQMLSTGIRQASARSEEPLICFIKPEMIRFVAVSGLRMVVSWEAQLEPQASGSLVFVVPPVIAGLLLSESVRSQPSVEIARTGRGQEVVLRLIDHLGSYDIRWKSDLAAFPAPPEFSELLKAPDILIDVPYLKISDAIHQAVAKLVQLESEAQVSQSKLAILIDLGLGRLRINGEEIIVGESRQYYFDPRLVIRALEMIRNRTVRVGVSPLKEAPRAYLSLLTEEEGWRIQCSLLSIGTDTQKLYPLPPGRNR